MGRRSGIPETEEDVASLTLNDLNQLIADLVWRVDHADLSSALRKSSFKSLVWLKERRAALHGIEAPKRKPPRN
jgi:hypothetical protein